MLSRVWELSEQIDHRGHEHGVSHVLSLHHLAENLRAKFRNCDLAGPECRGREHAGKIRDVEDRSGVQVGPAFGVAHPVVEVVDVSENIAMCHHDAFWLPRRAARVDETQNGLGVVKDIRNRIASKWEWFFIDDLLPAQLYAGNSERGMAHDPTRTRIFEHPVDLFRRQAGVYRNGDHREPAARV